ncbi:BON domain-containing protein [Chitinimonas arctica]|nr:BON domain-containing protein [Chitinimonas arctica]
MKPTPIFKNLLAMMLAGLALTACDRPSEPLDNTPPPPAPPLEPAPIIPPADPKLSAPAGDMPAPVGEAIDKAGAAVDDAALTTKVKAALAADAGLKSLKLDVDSMGGTVNISGTTASQESRDNIGKVVQGVEGVKTVNNKVTVKPG